MAMTSPLLDPQTVRVLLAGSYRSPFKSVKNPNMVEWRASNLAAGLTANGKPRKRGPYAKLDGMSEEQKLERRREQSSRANRAMRKAKYAVV